MAEESLASVLESVGDAADRLGVSIHHFRYLIKSGVIPFAPVGPVVRFGRRLFLHRRKLDDFITDGGAGFSGGWRREPSDDAEPARG